MNPDIQAIKEKIEKVSSDILKLSESGTSLQGIQALNNYKDYLEDELRNLEKNAKKTQ